MYLGERLTPRADSPVKSKVRQHCGTRTRLRCSEDWSCCSHVTAFKLQCSRFPNPPYSCKEMKQRITSRRCWMSRQARSDFEFFHSTLVQTRYDAETVRLRPLFMSKGKYFLGHALSIRQVQRLLRLCHRPPALISRFCVNSFNGATFPIHRIALLDIGRNSDEEVGITFGDSADS